MEKQVKYIGGWSAGSSYNQGYEFTSLAEAKKTMRAIAKGNTFAGSSGGWTVDDMDGNTVAEGRV